MIRIQKSIQKINNYKLEITNIEAQIKYLNNKIK